MVHNDKCCFSVRVLKRNIIRLHQIKHKNNSWLTHRTPHWKQHVVCAQHGHQIPKVSKYSRECKSLTGELVKPVSKSQCLPRSLSGVVWSDPSTEGSETTNSGTDEQERHTRLIEVDKQAHHCKVPDQQTSFSRCRRNWKKECVLTWGDPYAVR